MTYGISVGVAGGALDVGGLSNHATGSGSDVTKIVSLRCHMVGQRSCTCLSESDAPHMQLIETRNVLDAMCTSTHTHTHTPHARTYTYIHPLTHCPHTHMHYTYIITVHQVQLANASRRKCARKVSEVLNLGRSRSVPRVGAEQASCTCI